MYDIPTTAQLYNGERIGYGKAKFILFFTASLQQHFYLSAGKQREYPLFNLKTEPSFEKRKGERLL